MDSLRRVNIEQAEVRRTLTPTDFARLLEQHADSIAAEPVYTALMLKQLAGQLRGSQLVIRWNR